MSRHITPLPLTPEVFAKYGDVLHVDNAEEVRTINEGHTKRYHRIASPELTASDGKPSINIFRSEPQNLPFTVKLMERHPLSSQAFYPLGPNPYLVVVAPAGDLDPSSIEVFLAQPDQGVNYHAGTWHHYSLALGSTSDFLVVDRDADDENCDEVMLDEADWIMIEATAHG